MVVEPASVRACVRPFTFSKIFFSETAWPIKAKFYVECPWLGGTKVCVFYLDRIRTLVAMATYASHRLIMEKSENCLFLLSCLRYLNFVLQKCLLSSPLRFM